jgi:hypothetical protein
VSISGTDIASSSVRVYAPRKSRAASARAFIAFIGTMARAARFISEQRFNPEQREPVARGFHRERARSALEPDGRRPRGSLNVFARSAFGTAAALSAHRKEGTT